MVVLSKIYTRGGDAGKTSLGDGRRVVKHDLRVEAFGTVDEANGTIGLVRLHTAGNVEVDAMLARIQNDLFDLGADLCRPPREEDATAEHPPLRIIDAQVSRLEHEIDGMNEALEPLSSFVLPGGSAASAHLHLARTVVRRAERLTVALAGLEEVGEPALRYLNRLSDHLFVMARFLNNGGREDVLWRPGATR